MVRMTGAAGPGIRAIVADASRGRLIGVEREYEVADEHGPVDVRRLWALLPSPGASLDPGDPLARRGPSGGVITADGRHGEVATPPVVLRPGCTTDVLALAGAGEHHLAAQLSPRKLTGYSTHLNVQVADRRVVSVARLIAGRLALPLMLALDRRDSPGLLVRPRPGRLEIGGEFVCGDQLRAAMGLTVGMVMLAEHRPALARPRLSCLPRPEVTPAVERFGWFVDRRAFGPDLYAGGRDTRLGALTAGAVLLRLWESARPHTRGVLADSEIDLVDRAVTGDLPLPLELPTNDDGAVPLAPGGRDYGPRNRGGIEVRVLRATWWRAVLEIRGPASERWLTVPGRALDALLDALDGGELDADLALLTGQHTRTRGLPRPVRARLRGRSV